jgi:hypothetical protein
MARSCRLAEFSVTLVCILNPPFGCGSGCSLMAASSMARADPILW